MADSISDLLVVLVGFSASQKKVKSEKHSEYEKESLFSIERKGYRNSNESQLRFETNSRKIHRQRIERCIKSIKVKSKFLI